MSEMRINTIREGRPTDRPMLRVQLPDPACTHQGSHTCQSRDEQRRHCSSARAEDATRKEE